MTNNRYLAALSVLLLLAAPLSAQTRIDTFPGKVQIRSTATDALTVLGGASFAVALAGDHVVYVRNSLASAAATSSVKIGNDADVGLLELKAYSATYTGANNVSSITSRGGGGLDLVQTGASSTIRVYVNTSTLALTFAASGQLQLASGSVSAPSLSFAADTDTGIYLTGNDLGLAASGLQIARLFVSGGAPVLSSESGAFGTGAVTGSVILAGQNTSGADAPGCFAGGLKGGSLVGVLWIDSTGVVRTTTGLGVSACPTEAGGDTIGTVVGTQTSTAASKNIVGQVTRTDLAMEILRRTPIFAFTYKNGAFNGETFYGITTDTSPLFGMDHGKSFNPVSAFGATVLALQDLDARMRALEARQ